MKLRQKILYTSFSIVTPVLIVVGLVAFFSLYSPKNTSAPLPWAGKSLAGNTYDSFSFTLVFGAQGNTVTMIPDLLPFKCGNEFYGYLSGDPFKVEGPVDADGQIQIHAYRLAIAGEQNVELTMNGKVDRDGKASGNWTLGGDMNCSGTWIAT